MRGNGVWLLFAVVGFFVFQVGISGSDSAQAMSKSESQESFLESARNFLKMARRVQAQEPYLHHHPKFKREGAWTRLYQRRVAREVFSGDFKRMTFIPASHLDIERLERIYVKYGTLATRLMPEVFQEVQWHADLASHPAERALYLEKFENALDSLLPHESGPLPDFQALDCDYVSQPMNAMWFSIHAMHLTHQYASFLFPERWPVLVEELRSDHEIWTLEDMRDFIEKSQPRIDRWYSETKSLESYSAQVR